MLYLVANTGMSTAHAIIGFACAVWSRDTSIDVFMENVDIQQCMADLLCRSFFNSSNVRQYVLLESSRDFFDCRKPTRQPTASTIQAGKLTLESLGGLASFVCSRTDAGDKKH